MKKVLIVNTGPDRDDLQYYYNDYFNRTMSVPLRLVTEVEKLGEFETQLVFHNDVLNKSVEDYSADYVIVSGRHSDWRYGYANISKEFLNLETFLRGVKVPTLCICAGHQVCGTAHGSKVLNMGGGKEVYSELGFKKVMIKKRDLLFDGIEDESLFMMLHRDEMTVMPDGFELLASSEMCKIQSIKHASKPIYGMQFHPELYSEEFNAGHRLIVNFLNM